jgi:16S rRNA C1402 N4-methylase RsmH
MYCNPVAGLVVISFHSLEDRIVKQFIAKHSRDEYDRRAPFAAPKAMKLKALDASSPGQERWPPTRVRAAPSCAWPKGRQA